MKVVAITGGAQGIGRAIAYQFANAGYAVSIGDPAEDAGAEAVGEIEQRGGRALFTKLDTGEPAAIDAWVSRTWKGFGSVDALVNNAGIGAPASVLDLTVEQFDRVLAVNLRGAFLCSQAVARRLVEAAKPGAIVNIASTRALMSEPDTEAYAASKGGILALTHAMAISLGSHRIRVNAISPGWIETGDWQLSVRAKTPNHSDEDRNQHPIGRVGKPEDIAEAALFLAEKAGFITGQNLVIDGGMTVKMVYA